MDSLKKTQPENGEYETVSKITYIFERGETMEKKKKNTMMPPYLSSVHFT